MTREEAISIITKERDEDIFGGWTPYRKRIHEAFTLAIEALEGVCFDEWCDDCKEYDTEKKCCPRFNKVIREALKREPSEDGTLEVKVEDATKVGRVLISDDKHRGGLYYPDEYEPKGDDLISRAEAAEIFEAMLKTATDQKIKIGISRSWQQIKDLPSADRPKGDLISRADAIEALGEEPLVWCDDDYEIAERSQWRADIEAIKSVPSADRPRPIDPTCAVDPESGVVPISACEPKAPKTIIYADRPRGEWISVSEKPKDEKKTYLVQLDGGGMCSCRWTNTNPFWTDLTTEWHWCIFDIPQYSKVVAWMDLEPYKGGEDE